jgi:hypothetical protein
LDGKNFKTHPENRGWGGTLRVFVVCGGDGNADFDQEKQRLNFKGRTSRNFKTELQDGTSRRGFKRRQNFKTHPENQG